MNLEALGKISDILDDLTPIQIGTAGKFGSEFDVIGRMKVAYEDGFWNEWFVQFGDSTEGWLVEAQGFYALCKPAKDIITPSQTDLAIGAVVDFGSYGYFEIEDMRQVSCIYSEGELPVNAPQGRRSLSVDLTGFEDQMATIEYADNENRLYIGAYQDFDLFQFKNLRPIDGW